METNILSQNGSLISKDFFSTELPSSLPETNWNVASVSKATVTPGYRIGIAVATQSIKFSNPDNAAVLASLFDNPTDAFSEFIDKITLKQNSTDGPGRLLDRLPESLHGQALYPWSALADGADPLPFLEMIAGTSSNDVFTLHVRYTFGVDSNVKSVANRMASNMVRMCKALF